MSTAEKQTQPSSASKPPTSWKERLSYFGPGLIVAATGVGAGDLSAALVAGTRFEMALVWAIVLGAIIKYYLNEGVGRWSLASGQTILQGWRSLGNWTMVYFGIYIIIWGFIYGAAGTASSALATAAMFPQLDLKTWAILHGLAGFGLIWIGKYELFEKVMMWLTGLMFVTVVGSAVVLLPDVIKLLTGFVPTIPDGSFVYILGLIGGVGGTITMASYGYWIREKKWVGPAWIPIMRMDSGVAYLLTAIFTISLVIVGAEFLFGTGIELKDEKGLVKLAEMLGDKFGEPVRWLFLLGFWSASFTSVLGVWNGVPYLFADWFRHLRKKKDEVDTSPIDEKSWPFRAYLIWLTFPPMMLHFFDKPVGLIILYGVLGALFMPFLAITLFWLLNKKVEGEYKNKLLANIFLIGSIVMFAYLAYDEIMKKLAG